MVCSCSVYVLDVAALIHIVRSGRAATFKWLHTHASSALSEEPNNPFCEWWDDKITLPSRYRIRNSSPGGLRPSTLPLSHGGSSAPHNTYEWSLRVSGKESFVSLKPECQSGGRTRDLTTFQADRFKTTASPPPLCPNYSNWEYTNSKERLAKMSVQKKDNSIWLCALQQNMYHVRFWDTLNDQI